MGRRNLKFSLEIVKDDILLLVSYKVYINEIEVPELQWLIVERLFVFVVRESGPLKRDTSYSGKTNAVCTSLYLLTKGTHSRSWMDVQFSPYEPL